MAVYRRTGGFAMMSGRLLLCFAILLLEQSPVKNLFWVGFDHRNRFVSSAMMASSSSSSSSSRRRMPAPIKAEQQQQPIKQQQHSSSSSSSSSSRRWNGNYRHISRRLCDVPKSKKMRLQVRAHGHTRTLEKKRMETLQHVLTKAMIWKLFLDEVIEEDEAKKEKGNRPNENNNTTTVHFEIEHDIGDPDYLPDVVGWRGNHSDSSSSSNGSSNGRNVVMDAPPSSVVVSWGESGRMKPHKALDLMRRYNHARIIHCRWGMDLDTFAVPFVEYLQEQVDEYNLEHPIRFHGRFSFATLPRDVWRFIDEATGTILLTKEDVEWRELDVNSIVGPTASTEVKDGLHDGFNET